MIQFDMKKLKQGRIKYLKGAIERLEKSLDSAIYTTQIRQIKFEIALKKKELEKLEGA